MARQQQQHLIDDLIDDEKLLKNLKAGQTLGLMCTSFISSNFLMSLMNTYNGAGISSTKKKNIKDGLSYWRIELNSSHCRLNRQDIQRDWPGVRRLLRTLLQ